MSHVSKMSMVIKNMPFITGELSFLYYTRVYLKYYVFKTSEIKEINYCGIKHITDNFKIVII
jgi:hypothetical protein